ncbi:MAG: hypothetical protein ABIN80_16400 [Dyadobacter sp.]|uniref:hypothetical protein n=1 Tax=Dyadobacter sp. TaxID=1914288 RepID=UPI003264FC99
MPPEEPNPKARKINIEILLGVSAVVLSLAALFVSIFQTKIAREEQHASVWPYLQAYVSTRKGQYLWQLENRGIGPAIIQKVECMYDTTSYENPREFFFSKLGYHNKGAGFDYIQNGSVIKSGDGVNLIGIYENDSLGRKLEEYITGQHLNLRLVYSDVYGNCWQLDQGKVTPLDECPE